MSTKQVWAMAPKSFKTSTGKTVLVGVKTTYNTGKNYPANSDSPAQVAKRERRAARAQHVQPE